ncbi:putative glycosyltransferase EpsJ [compost metagenome]
MATDNQVINLSIVITAHNEGLIAHKTMLSIFEAADKLTAANISYEFIISIDNGTTETIEYFDRYNSKDTFTIIHAGFKDLSTSRNNAVKQARGKYITFLDADDLVSDEWLIIGYDIVKNNKNVIAHPEYSITFGDDNLMWQKRDSANTIRDTLCLVDNNLWDSPCMTLRETLLQYPYHPNGKGFGYEDKHFNCQTLAAGLLHVVAPKTLLFVRRKYQAQCYAKRLRT